MPTRQEKIGILKQLSTDEQRELSPLDKPLPSFIIDGKKGKELDMQLFVSEVISTHDICYVNHCIYTNGKRIVKSQLNKIVYDMIEPHLAVGARRVNELTDTVCIKATTDPPQIQADTICFKNCNITITKNSVEKTDCQKVCLYRVPHDFIETSKKPRRFIEFLQGLFYEEDIRTIQQYIGYSMLPNTRAQKALFIIGDGGEGKSRITVLMKELLGQACFTSQLYKLSEQFFGSNLENTLLFIDDDLQVNKFKDTGTFKSYVTAETEILAERKGKDHVPIKSFAKFLVMGNYAMGSLYDKSEGFYRRLHIVRVRPKDPNRPNNPTLIQDIWKEEKQEILFWAVAGAVDLVRNEYKLHSSQQSLEELDKLKEADNSAITFLNQSEFEYDSSYTVASNYLHDRYKEFCADNELYKVGIQLFKSTAEKFFEKHGVKYSENIMIGGRRQRGFRGVKYPY